MGLENVIIPAVSSIFTQLLKRAPIVPINSGQKARLRAVVIVLTGLGTIGLAYLQGTLGGLESLDNLVGEVILNALIAFGMYNAVS